MEADHPARRLRVSCGGSCHHSGSFFAFSSLVEAIWSIAQFPTSTTTRWWIPLLIDVSTPQDGKRGRPNGGNQAAGRDPF
eukprot:5708513-Prymnesium_polylepis.1